MKILSIDLSTKTGWAFFESANELKSFGCIRVHVKDFNVNDRPELSFSYPKNIVSAADEMAALILLKIDELKPDKVVIENTVKGRNRHTQRLLEFLHKSLLDNLIKNNISFHYMDPSEWRYVLQIKLSKDDKDNNKLVSKGKKRGKITKKHLSVKTTNALYNLNLKLKDNDIADAILLGLAYAQKYNK